MIDGRHSALLVGLGRIGVGYDRDPSSATPRLVPNSCATHARALMASEDFWLVGGVDPDPQAGETFRALYDLPAWAALSAVPGDTFDVVVVAAPTGHHISLATEAIARWGPRMLVCEKPCGSSVGDAQRLAVLAESHGTRVSVNYFRRYLPETAEIAELIRSPAVGAPVSGVVQYSHGLRVNGCHFVDLLASWLGQPSDVRVLPDVRPTTTGTPSFVVSYETGGSVAFLGGGESGIRLAEASLAFDGGLLTYLRGGAEIQWRPRERGARAKPPGECGKLWRRPMMSYQSEVYASISRTLASGGPLVCDLNDAIQTLRVLDGVT